MTDREPYPSLVDGDLRLRPVTLRDTDWITNACSDPAIARWTTVPWPYTTGHAEAFITESATRWAQQAGLRLAIEVDRRPVGMAGLDRREPGVAEIGYWVSEAARGRRAATRAAGLLADWAFSGPWRLDTVRLLTAVGNVASQRCCERLGAVRSIRPDRTVGHPGGPWWAYTWTLTATDRSTA